MKLFSLIIPTYNRFNILKQMLLFFQNQKFPRVNYEFIIVFDGKSNLSQKENSFFENFQKKGFQSKILFSPQKKGQAFCRNIGLSQAEGKIILFLDDDILPQKNLLQEHYSFLKDNTKIVSLGRVITIFPKGKHKHNIFTFLGENSLEQIGIPSGTPLLPQHVYTGNIAFYKSSDIFFPAELFQNYGYEDVVFGELLINKGFTILKNNSAIVFHRKTLTLEQLQKRATALGKTCKIWKKESHIKQLSTHYSLERRKFHSILKEIYYYKKYKDFYFSDSFLSEKDDKF
jgi:glycosyltransferase involved in cell wall biosynthesis